MLRPAVQLLASARAGQTGVLSLAASPHPELSPAAVVQPHRALRQALTAPDWDGSSRFQEVHLLATRSRQETLEYLALARQALVPEGRLYFCVENHLGADGWRKRTQPLHCTSRFHCKLLELDPLQLPECGDPRILRPPASQADFVSCPGLFSWDRLDRGSRWLLEFLPAQLPGQGADFGCGPGLLLRQLSGRGWHSLTGIDVDQRAVQACSHNNPGVQALWLDLVQERPGADFDWICLNPPFHDDQGEDRPLGLALLRQAAACLRPGGQLFLVFNQQLDYSSHLSGLGLGVEQVACRPGYKLLRCRKNVSTNYSPT